jgi:hypothetical protein
VDVPPKNLDAAKSKRDPSSREALLRMTAKGGWASTVRSVAEPEAFA